MAHSTVNLGLPSGIDESKILEIYDGDYDIYLPVLRAYADELPLALAKLRKISAETLGDYARTMHGVKGTSASACAEEARKAALNLETMAKAGDFSAVLAGNGTFLKYMDALERDIEDWFSKSGK